MGPADEISQAEKRRVLANDRQVAEDRRASTYHQQSQASLDDLSGGRYGAMPKPSVTGVEPGIRYPAQPPGSPWASDPTGQEPPTGEDVNAIEAVGEKHELQEKPKSEFVRHGWRRL